MAGRPLRQDPACQGGQILRGRRRQEAGVACLHQLLHTRYPPPLSLVQPFFPPGEEPGPAIKPNSEYPDWLFKLDLRPPAALEDLDPSEWRYWRELRKRQMEQVCVNRVVRWVKLVIVRHGGCRS